MGFKSDLPRLRSCLLRLLPHVDRNRVALTGGVALELYLAASGQRGHRQRIADLDFVASPLDAIAPSAAHDFLVSHYHVAQRGVPKGMVQLVDPATRLHLDIFPDLAGTVSRAQRMLVAGEVILVLDQRSMLEHQLQTLTKAPVDEKHWQDAHTLASLCDAPSPPRPARFAQDTYATDVTLVCDRCERSRSPAFPLSPKTEILNLLGYV